MKVFMQAVVYDAVWISTIWSGLITLAGLITIRALSQRSPVRSG
jgi:hypothetical protein